MTLRSTLFPSARFKLDTEKTDFDKIQLGHVDLSSAAIKRENFSSVVDVHDILAGVHNSGGDLNKLNTLDQNNTGKVVRTAVAATPKRSVGHLGQGENREAVGVLSPPSRLMGGEGTPVKGKHTLIDNMDNSEMLSNSKDAGADESARAVASGGVLSTASIELVTESKWRSVRKTPANPHTQANCLRQILLLQLDLIEQQQQQLQAKDKEIDELKADKETLLARIERMERRLQLTRKDPRDKRLFQPLEPWTPDKDDLWDLELDDSPQTNSPRSLPFSRGGKGHKRKFCFLDSKIQKSRGKGPKFSPVKSECGAGSPYQRELRSKETPEKIGLGRPTSERDTLHPGKEESELTAQMEELPFMSTTEMYLCRWHQPPPSPLREPSPKKEEVVAIPSWRENSMEPLDEDSANDVPEMLDDGVFLKRHAKLELDEKRRKRWDIQRIREQRMFQRLQQRMNKKKGIQESEPEVASFYPDTEDVESIIITPFLPVVAFGRPLPKLTQEWYHGAGGATGRVSQKDLSSK